MQKTERVERALAVAQRAAHEAGLHQVAGLKSARQVDHKGRYDLVTQIDRQCEEIILAIIKEAFPETRIIAEESSKQDDHDDGEVWLVDPLDGTTNYVHGYPVFCSSLALRIDGQTVMGLVYDPLRDEIFEAIHGSFATLNGNPIAVSQTRELSQSLLSTGFPADRCVQPDTNLERFATLTMQTRGVRRSGSAALDLCYTACGRLDGYWETRIFPWDVCAAALIVEESGGRVTDLCGGTFDGSGMQTLASNGRIHSALVESLSETQMGG